MQYKIEGPMLTKALENVLMTAGYKITLVTPHVSLGNLPKVLLPDVSVQDGRLGVEDFKELVYLHEFILVRPKTAGYQKLAVRVVKTKEGRTIHIVLGTDGKFSYVALSTEDFLKNLNMCEGNNALSKMQNMILRLEDGEASCIEFIPEEQGWTDMQTAQKMGWDYWWLSQ